MFREGHGLSFAEIAPDLSSESSSSPSLSSHRSSLGPLLSQPSRKLFSTGIVINRIVRSRSLVEGQWILPRGHARRLSVSHDETICRKERRAWPGAHPRRSESPNLSP